MISMTPFSELLNQGTAHAWLFIPSAILLGALHGLEPGHSKTMMAAFIIAVRGTVMQAVLLGAPRQIPPQTSPMRLSQIADPNSRLDKIRRYRHLRLTRRRDP